MADLRSDLRPMLSHVYNPGVFWKLSGPVVKHCWKIPIDVPSKLNLHLVWGPSLYVPSYGHGKCLNMVPLEIIEPAK